MGRFTSLYRNYFNMMIATGNCCSFAIPFILWTVTSFLCHKLGKEFLLSAETTVIATGTPAVVKCVMALTLTLTQCLVCLMTVTPFNHQSRVTTAIIISSHILATFATNLSMAFIQAASTFAIKLTEPVTMAVAHRLVFKTPISIETWLSLPMIICGSFIFSGSALTETTSVLGLSLAGLSNVILAARNVSMKKLQSVPKEANTTPSEINTHTSEPQKKSGAVLLRDPKTVAIRVAELAAIVIGAFYLQSQHILPVPIPYMVSLAIGSAIFHVSYSYISTNVVLKTMSVVSHSVANIFKRILVVLLLYMGGQRSASPWHFSGLLLAVLGLGVYMMKKIQQLMDNGRPQTFFTSSKPAWMLRSLLLIFIGFGLSMNLGTVKLASQGRKGIAYSFRDPFDQRSEQASNFTPQYSSNLAWYSSAAYQSIIKSSTMDSKDVEDFLSLRLLDHPLETDVLSKTLKSNEALILEAQRILLNMLRDLLGKARHVMLFEIATYSNKGDPAISVGEAMLLRKLNVTVVYYCETKHCTAESVERARKISESYEQDELVILMQGGGNLVGYHNVDLVRERVLNAFPTRTKVLFSQSIWLNKFNNESLLHCQKIYSNRPNFVMFLRDRQSLGIAQENFKGIKHVLAPDMAFGIGMLPRQLPPAFDVIWLKRGDKESPGYTTDDLPKNISFTYHVSDYLRWQSNKGATDMETSFLIATAGLQFLQRGRVLITDRLHGHILSTLLNIPHVLLDNPPFLKLSSFHKTWTASQSNVVLVTDKHQAVREAQKLLERYDSVLPKVGPFMSKKIWEH
ncbi:uncharacterized protein LOC101845863 [Aplysia californica]|uniref:Uncharacterized protein LOC101845863 n=1 Tax=Aplysia californica TaxID=6500 RepID=A0ABM1A545_APLCA|nr:uncharacterized protein LOC101845863 [Aplysia californica]